MKYEPPFGPPGAIPADASYVNGDPSIGRKGSVPPAAAFEYPQREIVNLITNSQQMPTDEDLNQMTRAVRDGKLIYCLDSGPLNTIEIASLVPAITNYTQGLTLHVLMGHTVTGPTTISIGNLNPTSVKRRDGGELQPNDLVAGQVATLCCDGTFFQLLNMGADGGVGGGTTALHKVDIPYVHDTGAIDSGFTPPTGTNPPTIPPGGFTNHVVGLYSPALPDINEGRTVEVKLNQQIWGPTDFAPNNFPVHPVAHPDGTPIQAGDGMPNQIWLLVFDSVQWQLLDVFNVGPQPGPTPKPTYKGQSLQFNAIGTYNWPGFNIQSGFYRYPSLNSNRSVFSVSLFIKWPQLLTSRNYGQSDILFSAGDEGGSWWGCTMNWLGAFIQGDQVGGGGTNIFELFWASSGGQVAGIGTYESYTGTTNGYYQGGILGDTKWHHILVNADGAHMTAYVDGTMVSQGNVTGPSPWNSTQVQCIGMLWSCSGGVLGTGPGFFDGTTSRLTEIINIDGQCLDWTHFAKAQNGIILPQDPSLIAALPFGPNGFWLNWQNATDVTANGLGKDYSGNNNNFTPTNFDLSHIQQDYPGMQQT